MKGIGPQLPLDTDEVDGTYSLTKTYREQVKQNFKNLLLTSPGEKMMNPDFGVGLRRFLFDPSVQVVPALKTRIKSQTQKYLPFIQIYKINVNTTDSFGTKDEDSQILSVDISYGVPSINLNTNVVFTTEGTN